MKRTINQLARELADALIDPENEGVITARIRRMIRKYQVAKRNVYKRRRGT